MEPHRLLAARPLADAKAAQTRTATRERPRILRAGPRPSLEKAETEQAISPAAAAKDGLIDGLGFDLDALLGKKRQNDQPVSLDPERAGAEPFARFHRGIVMDCLDRLSMLGRHRRARALSVRPRLEERLLAQIDALAVAGMTAEEAMGFVDSEVEDDPWAVWGPALSLACFAGVESLVGVHAMIRALPDEAREAGSIAASALAVSPHPELEALARDLMEAPEPIARAVGVDVASRRGWLSPAEATRLFRDPSPAVIAAALRAQVELVPRGKAGARPADRRGAGAEVPWDAMRSHLRSADPDVAWSAARALVLLGDPSPYGEARAGALTEILGAKALEILVLAGEPEDADTVLRIARGLPMTAEVLSALARFGHASARPLLLHALAQPELAEDAAEALATLFGPAVTGEAAMDPRAWTAATASVDATRAVRIRRGAPWSSPIVARECAALSLTGEAAALRLDELLARSGVRPMVDLDVFWPELRPALEGMA